MHEQISGEYFVVSSEADLIQCHDCKAMNSIYDLTCRYCFAFLLADIHDEEDTQNGLSGNLEQTQKIGQAAYPHRNSIIQE